MAALDLAIEPARTLMSVRIQQRMQREASDSTLLG
jgi:hypothetical protein